MFERTKKIYKLLLEVTQLPAMDDDILKKMKKV